MTSYVEIQLPDLPRGYRYTGVYRVPCNNDLYLDRKCKVDKWIGLSNPNGPSYPIIEKVKWEPRHGEIVWYINMKLTEVRSCDYNTRCMSDLLEKGLVFRTQAAGQIVLDLILDAVSGLNFNDDED